MYELLVHALLVLVVWNCQQLYVHAQASVSIPLECEQSTMYAVTDTDWHVSCDEAPTTKQFAFNPIHLQSFLLDPNVNLGVTPNAATPTQVSLTSAFHSIDALVSTTLQTWSLQPIAQWVHKQPVTIVPTAFAKLTALETLVLQDVPLADPSLHLVLPATLKVLVIAGCRLERLTIEFVDSMGNQANPTHLTQVDLHSNQLVEIPLSLYARPIASSLTTLDVRWNAFPVLTVSIEKEPVLRQWIVSGVLQVNQTDTPITCPSNSTQKRMEGMSQQVDVCVKSPSRIFNTSSTTIRTSSSHSQTILAPVTTLRSSKATETPTTHRVRSQIELLPLPLTPTQAQVPDHQRQSGNTPLSNDYGSDMSNNQEARNTTKHPPALMITLISVGVVSTVLAVVGLALVVHRQRARDSTVMKRKHSYLEPGPTSGMKDLDPPRPTQTLTRESSAVLMVAPSEDDLAYLSMARRSSCVSSTRSSEAMFTPLPEFPSDQDDKAYKRQTRSTHRVPECTPRNHKSIPTHHAPQATIMQQQNKQLLFTYLTQLCQAQGPSTTNQDSPSRLDGCIMVNRDVFQCFGTVEETETGAFVVQCKRHPDHRPTRISVRPSTDSRTSVSSPSLESLQLKIYVEQDIAIAIQEYRAMLVMQGTSCRPFIAQLVATEMDKLLVVDATGIRLQCAVLVMERGSPTTLRNIVRHQVDRSQQFAIVQQLYRVVRAIECVHTRQFLHGAVGLEAFCVFPHDQDALKLHSLEWATRYGDPLTDLTVSRFSTLEYTAPEFAQHALCHGFSNQEESDPSLNRALPAMGALDVWALGILIIKIYANSKQLDELQGCDPIHPTDFYLRIAESSFSFERSLKFYVHHEDVRDLARQCLKRDPRRRPTISTILSHRVFRAYDRLEQQVNFRAPPHLGRLGSAQLALDTSAQRELIPPSLWFFLPPGALSLDQSRTIDEWVDALTEHQFFQQRSDTQHYYSTELHFPLMFLCEDSKDLTIPCTTGLHPTRLMVPASLLSLVMPIVQQSTLFLEAKVIVSSSIQDQTQTIAKLSGLGTVRWMELMKFYRALEKMLLVPISSYSLSMLKPLEEKLASKEQEKAQQVLEELKDLVFSQEKREHVLSILDIIKTSPMIEWDNDSQDEEEEQTDPDRDTRIASSRHVMMRQSRKQWSGLRKWTIDMKEQGEGNECSAIRWLCPHHVARQMECSV